MHYDQVKVQRQVSRQHSNSLTVAGVLLLLPHGISSIAPLPQQQQHHQHNIHATSDLSNIYTILLYVGLPKAKTVHLRRKRLPLSFLLYTTIAGVPYVV